MKKIYLSLFLLIFSISTSWAQLSDEPTSLTNQLPLLSKRGTHILPEAGDWSLGINTYPFFNYFASLFNGNQTVNSPWLSSSGNPTGNPALTGKYFINANTAYRASIGLEYGQNIRSGSVPANNTDMYNLGSRTVDKQRTVYSNVALAIGIEKRRGHSRLQGKYGADAYIGYTTNNIYYHYGNQISSSSPSPYTYNFGNNIYSGNNSSLLIRTNYESNGRRFTTGVRGFIGLEYFVAPKIALGGEFGYNLGVTYQSRPETRHETYSPDASGRVDVHGVNTTPGTLSFGTGINNLNSAINLHFYF